MLGEEFGSSLAPGEASHFGSFFSSAGSKVALLVAFFRRLVRSRTLWVAFFSAPGQKSHFGSLFFGVGSEVALLVALFPFFPGPGKKSHFWVAICSLFCSLYFCFLRKRKKAKKERTKGETRRRFTRPKVHQKVDPPPKVRQKVRQNVDPSKKCARKPG